MELSKTIEDFKVGGEKTKDDYPDFQRYVQRIYEMINNNTPPGHKWHKTKKRIAIQLSILKHDAYYLVKTAESKSPESAGKYLNFTLFPKKKLDKTLET